MNSFRSQQALARKEARRAALQAKYCRVPGWPADVATRVIERLSGSPRLLRAQERYETALAEGRAARAAEPSLEAAE